jgi:nucleoside-diphosphate-sugar epimerase
MTSLTKLLVVVAGASGETGQSSIKGLLAKPAQFQVVALARPESAGKAIYQGMAASGVNIATPDFCDVASLAERLQGADVVISCLLPLQRVESKMLIDAAHHAGVGRFIPSFWSMVMPPRGIMSARDVREDQPDRCKRLYLPYTVVDVGMWYQAGLPPPFAPPAAIGYILIGNGDTPTAMTGK